MNDYEDTFFIENIENEILSLHGKIHDLLTLNSYQESAYFDCLNAIVNKCNEFEQILANIQSRLNNIRNQ